MSANRLVRSVPAPGPLDDAALLGRTTFLSPGTSIAAAITALAATPANPGVIVLAPGVYDLDVALTLTPGLTLEGVQRDACIVEAVVNCFMAEPAAAPQSVRVAHLTIRTPAAPNQPSLAITSANPMNIELDSVRVDSAAKTAGANDVVSVSALNVVTMLGACVVSSPAPNGAAAGQNPLLSMWGGASLTVHGSLELKHTTGEADAIRCGLYIEDEVVLDIAGLTCTGCGIVIRANGALLNGVFPSRITVDHLVVDNTGMTIAPVELVAATNYHIKVKNAVFKRANALAALSAVHSWNFAKDAPVIAPDGMQLTLGDVQFIRSGATSGALYAGGATNITNLLTPSSVAVP